MDYISMTDKQIESGLRALGFLFPETIQQVEYFEAIGNPDINFPIELQESMLEKVMQRINESSNNVKL